MREVMFILTRAGGVIRGARAAAQSRTTKILALAFLVVPAVLLGLSLVGADVLAIPVLVALGLVLLFRWPVLTGLTGATLTAASGYPEAGLAVAAVTLAMIPVLRIIRANRESGGEDT